MRNTGKSKKLEPNTVGREFQARVADVYRLLGADVTENIDLLGKKIDILAEFPIPGSISKHTIIVECKSEAVNRAQNQRILEFAGLLKLARASGIGDAAEIVTIQPWSEQAKGIARTAGVQLATYSDKIRRLMDFSQYDSNLQEDVATTRSSEALPIAETYVPIFYKEIVDDKVEAHKELLPYLFAWASAANGPTALVVLGEYGSGKTTICRLLAAMLAKQHQTVPEKSRIPILINLRDFTKSLRIESLISSHLDDYGVGNPRFRLFDMMNRNGLFTIIVDGFDEMAVKVDPETIEFNLLELEKLVADGKSRLLLTTRPEYFISGIEQKKAFRPRERMLHLRKTEYREVTIIPWQKEEVEAFFRQRLPAEDYGQVDDLLERVASIDNLLDLSSRPVFAEMIAKTLPELISSGEKISRASLYQTYILFELARQRIAKNRHFLMDDKMRLAILQDLSWDLYDPENRGIDLSMTIGAIRRFTETPDNTIEHLAREFLSCSFLIRQDDIFRFSHKTFQEFLAASLIIREITSGFPEKFGRFEIRDKSLVSFLLEIDKDSQQTTKTLAKWIAMTKQYANINQRHLGGAAATLLCAMHPYALASEDLGHATIRRADMRFSDLSATKFRGATLEDVDLRNSIVSMSSLLETLRLSVRMQLIVVASSLGPGWLEDIVRRLHEETQGKQKSDRSREEENVDGISIYSITEPRPLRMLCLFDIQIKSVDALRKLNSFLSTSVLIEDGFLLEERIGRVVRNEDELVQAINDSIRRRRSVTS